MTCRAFDALHYTQHNPLHLHVQEPGASARDPDCVGALCLEAIAQGTSVLVMCGSKASCESVARLVARLLPPPSLSLNPNSKRQVHRY